MSRKCKGKCGLRNVCGNAAKVLQKVEVRSKRCGSREFWLNRGERGEGGVFQDTHGLHMGGWQGGV